MVQLESGTAAWNGMPGRLLGYHWVDRTFGRAVGGSVVALADFLERFEDGIRGGNGTTVAVDLLMCVVLCVGGGGWSGV